MTQQLHLTPPITVCVLCEAAAGTFNAVIGPICERCRFNAGGMPDDAYNCLTCGRPTQVFGTRLICPKCGREKAYEDWRNKR